GVKYLVDGKELPSFPADLDVLAKVEVEYVTLPGWQTPIVDCKSFDQLPEACQKYVEYIEEWLKVKIEWIGVGPGRESMLRRSV
ncbi:P-loop containing nucleoside triphosphate hydrolase protein, partial [Exidia glandulosa HHB12029]